MVDPIIGSAWKLIAEFWLVPGLLGLYGLANTIHAWRLRSGGGEG